MTRAHRIGRFCLGILVAYVLAFQGMAGAFAAARHVAPPPAGLLCSGAAVPADEAPQAPALHQAACDLFCGVSTQAALPPVAGAATPFVRVALVIRLDAPADQSLRRAALFLPQQPRAPPFAI